MDIRSEKIVLFGAGNNSKKIIKKLGINKIETVIDNIKGLYQEEIEGIKIRNFEIIEKKSLKNKFVVITPDDENAKIQMMTQLIEVGCDNWIFADMLTEEDELINFNEKDKYIKAINIYKRLYNSVAKENKYLREHIDPSTLKPAKGFLRKKQLDLVKYAFELSQMFEDKDIRLILSAGNLLGLLRHNGFIPWDDDIDLKLLRTDYEKLKSYCRENFVYKKYNGLKGVNVEYMNFKKYLFEKYPNRYIFLELPEHCQILRGTNVFDGLSVDLFVIDSYKDDYLFSEHKSKLINLKENLMNCETCLQQFDYLDNYLGKDSKEWDSEGNNLFYGGDNVESYAYYIDYDEFLNRNNLLPLKKKEFEGYSFWIPNHPEKCVEYVFGKEWKNLPRKVGVEGHSYWNNFFEKYYDSADIVYDENYTCDYFEKMYYTLRRKNIYTKILFPQYITNENIDKAIMFFDEKGIEWSCKYNKFANVCYTDSLEIQNNYQEAKIIMLKDFFDTEWVD